MDEDDLVKAGMEVVLRPVTDIAENALGLMGGDWLSEKRARNRARLKAKTEEILRERGAKLDSDPSPSIVTPLLSAAQDEGREELQDLWAKLVAGAMDPKRRDHYRREFVAAAKELEPPDVLVFPLLRDQGQLGPNRKEYVMSYLKMSGDQVELAFRNLERAGLIEFHKAGDPKIFPLATALGRQFLVAVSD